MITICSLSSGSKGNSLYLQTEHTRVLIDIGLSALQIRRRLETIGVEPESIDAIVITHAHADHIRGAGVFARKHHTPIYAHPETLDAMTRLFRGEESLIPWNGNFRVGDIHFFPFPVSHDAYPTVGYRIEVGTRTITVCTDLGFVTPEVKENVRRAEMLILESNHDPEMLMNGPYPWDLKERIASRVGHLSNHDTGELLREILNGRLQRILLAHLSEENNTPELARNTVLEYLTPRAEEMISVLEQKKISPIFEL